MVEIAELTKQLYTYLRQAYDNVFPIVATEGASLPFIVFERSNAYDTGTKDGNQLEVAFNVRVVTATYFDGLTLVDKIRRRLRMCELKPTLTGASEEYTTDGYVQTLSFTFQN